MDIDGNGVIDREEMLEFMYQRAIKDNQMLDDWIFSLRLYSMQVSEDSCVANLFWDLHPRSVSSCLKISFLILRGNHMGHWLKVFFKPGEAVGVSEWDPNGTEECPRSLGAWSRRRYPDPVPFSWSDNAPTLQVNSCTWHRRRRHIIKLLFEYPVWEIACAPQRS